MFYLTTHSTDFIYGYMASDIWLRTILIARKESRCRHMGYCFRLTASVFYMHHPTDRIAHTTAFVTSVVGHWLEREIAQWVHPMKDRSDDPSHHDRNIQNATIWNFHFLLMRIRQSILLVPDNFRSCKKFDPMSPGRVICLFGNDMLVITKGISNKCF